MGQTKKVAIVTGANVGIGLETARALAKQGMHVVLACRDAAKGAEARAEIAAGQPDASLEVMPLDLARQTSIRAFAEAFLAQHDRLDVLVNNAGVVTSARSVTEDGHETQLAVNHLGPFLLTRLLMPALEKAAPSRVVVVSSSAHTSATIDWDDLEGAKQYSYMATYSRTKLMNVLFVRALAKRLEGKGVTVNAVHPGVVATQLARDMPKAFQWMARLFFTTPAKGARTSVHVATAPEVASVSGKYFAGSRQATPSKLAQDDAAAERLWKVSSEMVALPA